MPECLPRFHFLRFLFCFPPHLLHPWPRPSSMIDRLDDDDAGTMKTELQSRQSQSEDPALLTEKTEH